MLTNKVQPMNAPFLSHTFRVGEDWNENAKAIGMDFKRRQTFFDLKIQLKGKRLVHETQGRWYITTR
jgi:hypothetical protein